MLRRGRGIVRRRLDDVEAAGGDRDPHPAGGAAVIVLTYTGAAIFAGFVAFCWALLWWTDRGIRRSVKRDPDEGSRPDLSERR